MKNKKIYFLLGVVLLLVITNPSLTRFDEFTKTQPFYETNKRGFFEVKIITGRINNFFVFSIYTASYGYSSASKKKYIGVAGNFIEIKQ